MVNHTKGFTQSGARDFLFQRFSAVYMTIFLLSLVIYFVLHPVIDFYNFHALFSRLTMRIAFILFMSCLIVHAWIGLWAVFTDYLKNSFMRLIFLIMTFFMLFACFIWSLMILGH